MQYKMSKKQKNVKRNRGTKVSMTQLPRRKNNLVETMSNHLLTFFDETEFSYMCKGKSGVTSPGVFTIKASEYRPFTTILSCGLSTTCMDTPEGYSPAFYEVMMLLPPNWPTNKELLFDGKNQWPYDTLLSFIMNHANKHISYHPGACLRYPGEQEIVPGLGFNSALLWFSRELSQYFTEFQSEGHTVNILTTIPLYPEEYNHNAKFGPDSLLERFDEFGIEEIVQVGRPNSCRENTREYRKLFDNNTPSLN